MKNVILITLAIFLSVRMISQNSIKLDANKVIKFTPYLEYKHGGKQKFITWKNENKILYTKEMWYYSESFYIKRNFINDGVLLTGLTLDESVIDISRFEYHRKQNDESIVMLPGFKDVIVLIPINKLIYKP